jgi:hypothetical protein
VYGVCNQCFSLIHVESCSEPRGFSVSVYWTPQQDLSTPCAHGRVEAQLSAVCISLHGGRFVGAVACGNLHLWKDVFWNAM